MVQLGKMVSRSETPHAEQIGVQDARAAGGFTRGFVGTSHLGCYDCHHGLRTSLEALLTLIQNWLPNNRRCLGRNIASDIHTPIGGSVFMSRI
jgi:hypothetical protein